MDADQIPTKITPFHIAIGIVFVLSILVILAINQLFQPLQTTTTTTTTTTVAGSSTTTISITTTTTTAVENPLLQKPSDGSQTPPTLPA